MRRLLLLCVLFASMSLQAQQLQKEGIGRKGDTYTYFQITIPVPDQIPEKVNKSIAKQLFDTAGITVNEAHKAYLAQYDEVLPANKKNYDLAGYRRHSFNIQWFDYVEGRFASLRIEVKKFDSQGKKEKNRKKPMVYDLAKKRALKLNDVFADSTLAVIQNNGGDRHLFYIDKVGIVTVLSRINKKWENEEFSTEAEKESFQPSFLALVSKEGVAQTDVLTDAVEEVQLKADRKAYYPGGWDAVKEYFNTNVRIPREAFENKRYVEVDLVLEIDVNGRVTDVEVQGAAHFMLEEELVRVAKRMRGWRPAVENGKVVKSKVKLLKFTYRNPQWREK